MGWTSGNPYRLREALRYTAIDSVGVDVYTVARDGSIVSYEDKSAFVSLAHNSGLKVFATIANIGAKGDFDRSVLALIFSSPENLSNHISHLVELAENAGYDGIDIDYESLKASDRDTFSGFIEQLAQALHEAGKQLSIAVHAKESEPGDWDGAQAEDWRRIGAVVDEFRVMTYDYSGSWSSPGPVAPLSWMNRIIGFAETVVPSNKVWMGIPFYGYDWHNKTADAVTPLDVQRLLQRYHPAVTHDASSEALFRYRGAHHIRHTVYYQDASSIAAKLRLLTKRHPNIAGIAIWNLDYGTKALWRTVQQAK